ncbi:hypothetical protein HXZ94_15585 [Empedobacter falsenii]|uniref:hypothetical protein n=1 Tax=Empedobacter falsenii TaxID=343874 RepID=UPI0025765876|nr:hypothetical protein [Empedobacter falsenii]MDM1299917.1 hypothetical protein [Empedobacter falsenii]MDM1319710.1 hypothetical protein [Empedobacter falsenii]
MQTIDFNNLNLDLETNSFSELRNLMIKSAEAEFIGSDQHLDLVNSMNEYLDFWISEIQKINDFVEENFPAEKEYAKVLNKNLLEMYGGLNISLSLLKSNNSIYNSHITRYEALQEEANQILEYILDIERFILKKSNDSIEIDNLLKSM